MSANIGYATLQVIPSLKGVSRSLQGGLGNAPEVEGRRAGSKLGAALGGVFKKSAIGIGVTAGGLLSGALVKGWGRLTAIENAKAKLSGLGNSAATVQRIMDGALAAVKGTAFGLDEAATVAAGAVASGIKPGKELQSTLRLVADAATIGGSSMGEMGAIFNKVAASGKLQGDVIAQLGDRGIPILQMLGKQLHLTPAAVSKLASQGKVDFATFSKAMQGGLGGAALKSGATTQGAFKNMGAALSRFGATLLQDVYPYAKTVFGGLTSLLDAATARVGPLIKAIADKLGPVIQTIAGWIGNLWGSFAGSGKAGGFVSSLGDVFATRLLPAAQAVGRYFTANVLPILQTFGRIISQNVLPLVRQVAAFFVQKVVPALMSTWQAVAQRLRPVLDALVSALRTYVLPALQQILEKLREWWPTIQTVIMWVLKVEGAIAKFAATILATVLPPLIKFAGWLIAHVVPAITGTIDVIGRIIAALVSFGRGVGNAVTGVGHAMSSMYNQARDWIGKTAGLITGLPGRIAALAGGMLNAGKDLIGALFRGLSNSAGFVGDFAKALVNKIVDGLNAIIPHKLHIHIPIPYAPDVNVNVPLIPKIPHLARGGMTSGPMAALIGDNPSGNELVMPMDSPRTIRTLAQSMREAFAAMPGGPTNGGGVQLTIHEADNVDKVAGEVMRRLRFAGVI